MNRKGQGGSWARGGQRLHQFGQCGKKSSEKPLEGFSARKPSLLCGERTKVGEGSRSRTKETSSKATNAPALVREASGLDYFARVEKVKEYPSCIINE